MNITAAYSIISTEFSNEREKYFGYIELSFGMGMFLGPFISGLVYQYLNYFGTFMMFTAFLVSGVITALILLPERFNYTHAYN